MPSWRDDAAAEQQESRGRGVGVIARRHGAEEHQWPLVRRCRQGGQGPWRRALVLVLQGKEKSQNALNNLADVLSDGHGGEASQVLARRDAGWDSGMEAANAKAERLHRVLAATDTRLHEVRYRLEAE